jgi:hypothetical protein
MSLSVFKNGDLITSLPTDEQDITPKEKIILDMLYPTPSLQPKNIDENAKKTLFHFKDIVIASLLFFIINMPIVDQFIEKYTKTTNVYYKLCLKIVIFAVLLFVINNFSLSKKS